MRPVGFLTASRLVAAKDLRLEWQTWETLSSSVVFCLIVLVIFNFAFGAEASSEFGVARLVPGVLWTLLAFAAVVAMARSSELERRGDTLAAMLLAPIDRGAMFTGKVVANLVKLTLLEIVIVPLAAVVFNFDLFAVAAPLLGVLVLHTVGITLLGTMFAAIVARVGRGEALLATLLFPASTPLFISAVKCTAELLETGSLDGVSRWLLLSAGFDGLYLTLGMIIFEFVLED
ncbi:heme exporter protein CcmB [bacterium]|nr:heme exporter protein CcmB [bacterium]